MTKNKTPPSSHNADHIPKTYQGSDPIQKTTRSILARQLTYKHTQKKLTQFYLAILNPKKRKDLSSLISSKMGFDDNTVHH
jgi:hypothetical protein